MIADVGKTPAVLRMRDGSVITFYNNGIWESPGTINYKDENNSIRYTMTIQSTDANMHYRALHYSQSFPGNITGGALQRRLVLFTNPANNQGGGGGNASNATSSVNMTATPLFQVISPQIYMDGNNYQMSFWTNVSNPTLTTRYENIVKVSQQDMDDIGDIAAKVLYTCPIHFELLLCDGDSRMFLTPVIKQIVPITIIANGNPVFDFAGGGSGGGMGKHSHTNTLNDCGFAVAVYSPSAIITPLSWS